MTYHGRAGTYDSGWVCVGLWFALRPKWSISGDWIFVLYGCVQIVDASKDILFEILRSRASWFFIGYLVLAGACLPYPVCRCLTFCRVLLGCLTGYRVFFVFRAAATKIVDIR